VNSVSIANNGSWHHWEVQLVSNTPNVANGVCRFWLDGVKVGEYTNIEYSDTVTYIGTNWTVLAWTPVWGGKGNPVSTAMYMWMDDYYASGAP
jgi:hypothetical protein